MTDEKLIAHVAKAWVANGGDLYGFYFLVGSIGTAIKKEIEHFEDELYQQEIKDADHE